MGIKLLFGNKKILNATHIECPSCETVRPVDKWNEGTITVYGSDSPDVRNAALNKKNTFPYQCPECHMGFSAHKLNFVTKETD
nr:hypothetical protein [Evansella caseinilytica]